MTNEAIITDLSDPRFLALFTGVQESWFRLETLQEYKVFYEEAEYEEFLRTGKLDREVGEWQHMISSHTSAGRRLQRVHVVEEPLTDYMRFEMIAYRNNSRAGEEIRILPVRRGSWPSDLPKDTDFWLFDDRDVWMMEYDDTTRFRAARFVTEIEAIELCKAWRDIALADSITLHEYSG